MQTKKNKYKEIIDRILVDGQDITKRAINTNQGEIYILFIKQLTDRVMLSNYIIRPITQYIKNNITLLKTEDVIRKVILTDDCWVEDAEEKIIDNILNGMTVVLLPNEKDFIVSNIRKVEKKQIDNPELTYTIRGPRDSFTENLDTNLSLIRYRIKDPNYRVKIMLVGKRTKTRVAVSYIDDIVNDRYLNEIIDRIEKIETDGIIESGELQAFLLNDKLNLFPQMGLVERSDMACAALLEGKVVVLTEGSGIGLIAPKLFSEFLTSCDDLYDNKFMGTLSKFIRIISIIMTITLSSLYVAVISFHSDILPGEYIITLASSRATVPFNAFTETLIVEFVIEILREALIRVPKQIGSAVGIVGAIVIGQAAVAAGIFSPLILIISALTLLTSFVAPDYTIVNPLRILKFLMLILTGSFGLLGFTVGISFITTMVISSNSFGVPFFAPFGPYNWYDFTRTIFYNKTIAPKRPNFLRLKDDTRE